MSFIKGANTVRNGLVFHYDMHNTRKSFKGKPTENIISSQEINHVKAEVTYTYVGLDNGWKKYSISGTWASGTYPYSFRISTTVFTGGIYYSGRLLLKTNVRSKFAKWPDTDLGVRFVNEAGNTSGSRQTASLGYDRDGLEILEVKVDGHVYSTTYANPTTTQFGYIVSQPLEDGTTFDSATDFVWVKEIQVEQNMFTTPYVNGTRSNDDAIIDLTSNNTATANSLTYNSDGTFEFDGTNDYMTIPSSGMDFSDEQTIEIWLKTDTLDVRRNPYDQAYGGYGTLTIETNGKINYFWGSAGTNAPPYTAFGTGTGQLEIGVISCMCVTRSTTAVTWYKNGEVTGTASNSHGSLPSTSNDIRIGDGYVGNFNGNIYSVRLYTRALSAAEVSQNFQALRSRYNI